MGQAEKSEKTMMFALPNALSGQLACVAGSVAGRSWDLSAGTFAIGRVDDNDLALSQEPGVSKVHAKIVGQGDRYLIVDCESRNGTLVNGVPVQRADLYDGDEIKICGCTLRFTQKGGPNRHRARPDPAAPSLPGTPVVVVAPPPPLPAPRLELPLPEPALEPPPPPAPSFGKVLGGWYFGGLLGSLLLGGAASAALVATAPTPAPVAATAVVAEAAVAPPVSPEPVVAPPALVPSLDAGTPAGDPAAAAASPTTVLPDAGVVAGPSDAGVVAAPPPIPVAAVPVIPPTPVAVAEPEAAADEPEPAVAAKGGRRPKRVRPAAAPPTPSAAPVDASEATFPATVDGAKLEALRYPNYDGRVESVDAADGDTVVEGQVLLTFQAAHGPVMPVSAPSNGRLTGFKVLVGAAVRHNELFGRLASGDFSSRVRITVPKGTKVTKGQTVTLLLRGGARGEGSVVAVSGKVVIVDTGSESGDAVTAVKF